MRQPAVGSFFRAREPVRLKAIDKKLFKDWHEEALEEWKPLPSWCLFRRDAAGRQLFRRSFFQLNRPHQRAVILWAFCVATGRHKVCTREGCEEDDATKEHLELAHLPVSVIGTRNGRLIDTRHLSAVELQDTAELISDLIGSRPNQYCRLKMQSTRTVSSS